MQQFATRATFMEMLLPLVYSNLTRNYVHVTFSFDVSIL